MPNLILEHYEWRQGYIYIVVPIEPVNIETHFLFLQIRLRVWTLQ